MRPWRTEVEKGFVWTVVDHELVGPKFKAKAENFQVIMKNIYICIYLVIKHLNNFERKGIRFQFRNLLSIRLLINMGHCAHPGNRNDHKEAVERYRKSFLFCFIVVLPWKSFEERYGRWTRRAWHLLLCRYFLLGPWKFMVGSRKLLNRPYQYPQLVSKVKSL